MRLGFPRSLPLPPGPPPKAKARATPNEVQTPKKSAMPVRPAPADHGGAVLAIGSAPKAPPMPSSVPKAPIRPDDTRRKANRIVLAGAPSEGTLHYRRPLSATPAPMCPDDNRCKLNRSTVSPAVLRLAPKAPPMPRSAPKAPMSPGDTSSTKSQRPGRSSFRWNATSRTPTFCATCANSSR